MSNLLFCAYCNKHRTQDGGQFNVHKNKSVKFRCRECKGKIKKPNKLKIF